MGERSYDCDDGVWCEDRMADAFPGLPCGTGAGP